MATAAVTDSQRSIEESGDVATACPKHMVYGPCGGVRATGGARSTTGPARSSSRPVVAWAGPPPAPSTTTFAAAVGRRRDDTAHAEPIIVTDLRVRPFDRASVTAVAARLAATADALLIGEHHVPPDFPPTVMAELVRTAGARPWVTLTCRDRNRVVLESELAGLADQGVAGVHCVTGDSRARSVRTTPPRCSTSTGPGWPGWPRRPGCARPCRPHPSPRPRSSARRGCSRSSAPAPRCASSTMPVAPPAWTGSSGGASDRRDAAVRPCVAVITDVESLVVLERFPGLVVDPEVRRSVLEADDGRAAGIAAAVLEARRMLAIDGVVGVNLSGSATAGPETESAAIMAEVAETLRAQSR